MADKLDLTGITFDPELPEPLYLQLADALHERIKYHTGDVQISFCITRHCRPPFVNMRLSAVREKEILKRRDNSKEQLI